MATKTKNTAIGIDFGTSNSCVAICKDGRAETIPPKFGGFLLPSWVTYKKKEILVGETAKQLSASQAKNTIFAIKRILGRQFNDPVVQAAIKNWKCKVVEDTSGAPKIEVQHNDELIKVSPEEISALILKELKESAESYLGESEITDAVITVPAYFNDHQRQATIDAARIAGLNVLRLINEPTAAAVAYIHNKSERENRNVMVYDLGGGTFDVSVVNIHDSNICVKATYGDTNLGGINFDERCVEYLTTQIKHKHGIDTEKKNVLAYTNRLRNMAEKSKINLSAMVETVVELDELHEGEDVYETFTRARFEHINDDLFLKTIDIVEQCIKQANLKKEDIDDVLLVGGSTRIPKVEEYLVKLFHKPVGKAINQEHGVAHGAAILAASLNGTLSTTLNISDVTSMSLGIEILNGKMNVLIKRNSQIPTQARRVYTTGVEGENAIKITVLEGDSALAAENSVLGDFDLVNLPLNPSVDVTFDVDCNGILTVSAMETSTGISKVLNVTPNKGRLTSREIMLLRRKSYMVKKKNDEYNSIREKKNDFETYLLKTQNLVKSDVYKINSRKKDILLNKIEDCLTWLARDADDIKKIEVKYNEIHRYCTNILMDA